jgi:hypothetical protein
MDPSGARMGLFSSMALYLNRKERISGFVYPHGSWRFGERYFAECKNGISTMNKRRRKRRIKEVKRQSRKMWVSSYFDTYAKSVAKAGARWGCRNKLLLRWSHLFAGALGVRQSRNYRYEMRRRLARVIGPTILRRLLKIRTEDRYHIAADLLVSVNCLAVRCWTRVKTMSWIRQEASLSGKSRCGSRLFVSWAR